MHTRTHGIPDGKNIELLLLRHQDGLSSRKHGGAVEVHEGPRVDQQQVALPVDAVDAVPVPHLD